MVSDLKIIDLFCGAGGFSLGFEQAGFESILAIDMWDQAIETYNFNFKNRGTSIDIHDYSNDKIKKLIESNNIVGIIGGPPCQGFSMVGTRDSNDERNSLYLEYVRFTKEINPIFFVLENVKGLLNLKNGYFKRDIKERFENLGYNVSMKVLKASEYGIPQNRERVFFVGFRKDIFKEIYFEFPKGDSENFISTYDALSDLPDLDNGNVETEYKIEPQNEYQRAMRKSMNKIYNNEITKHTEKTKDIIAKVPDGGKIKDVCDELYKVRNYSSAFKRMNSKLPSTTIDCGHRNYFHYSQNRIPTVRESARIQSFPDSFIFTGSKTSQYTQVGNAVPPLLAKAVAVEIKKYLRNRI